jgi:hypothetical protein
VGLGKESGAFFSAVAVKTLSPTLFWVSLRGRPPGLGKTFAGGALRYIDRPHELGRRVYEYTA